MGKEKKTITIAEVIQRRKMNLYLNRQYGSLFIKVLLLILAGWFIFTEVFLITQVNGNNMFPSIKDGDVVIAFRLQEEYTKEDVILYSIGKTQYVGRILAWEGDVIRLDDSGTLLVNGTVQSGEIMYPTYAKEGLEYPYVVPENHFFVLGDYRTQTIDSRDFGAVSQENIDGKVITIVRRRGL